MPLSDETNSRFSLGFVLFLFVCVRQNLVFKALFGSVSDDKYFLLPHANKKKPLPVLLNSDLRLYGFVDIDSAFESELDIVFSFDLYAID